MTDKEKDREEASAKIQSSGRDIIVWLMALFLIDDLGAPKLLMIPFVVTLCIDTLTLLLSFALLYTTYKD